MLQKGKRRGSLAIVVIFATLMASAILGVMQISSTMYRSVRQNAEAYARYQDCRAVCELSSMQFVYSLCAPTAKVNLIELSLDMGGADVPFSALGYRAMKEGVNAIINETAPQVAGEHKRVWVNDGNPVDTVGKAIAGIIMENPEILTELIARVAVSGYREYLEVSINTLSTNFELVFVDDVHYIGSTNSMLGLSDFVVRATYECRGEKVIEDFVVRGLAVVGTVITEGDNKFMVVSISAEGVSITRV